ncbi:MAG: alpha-galactosidase [Clostridiales bacterium]|nr:alpha-galactosidase [Clostridiales bacterium]
MEDKKKIFKLGIPDYIGVETEEEYGVMKQEGSRAFYGKTKVEIAEKPEGEMILLTSEEAVREVRLRWNRKISKKARFLSDEWERGYGEMEWRGMSGRRFMPWYFLAALPEQILCFGVKVRPSAMCYWQVDSEGITLVLDVRCGGVGVQLNGRTLEAAQIVCLETLGISSFETARAFCGIMCTDPVLPEFPVYGSNNWYYAYGDSSEEEILSDTDYVLELTEGAENPPYMVIDDCWQEHHRLNEYNGGPWRKGNEKFPDMKQLAKKLEQKGVRPGIWVRLLQNEDEAIPDSWRISHSGCLDPSHPDAMEYIKEDVRRICGWGYTLIKHDFSTFDLFGRWGFEMNPLVTEDGWHFYDRHKTSAEIVKALYEGIFEASRSIHAIILGCNTIGHLGAGLMQISRTGDDTSGRTWERTRRMGINTLAFRLPQHGTFYHVDADCVGIAGNIPWELNRQWADVLAESGTPLFISAKPGLMNEEEKEELHQIMLKASTQECHRIPADWEDTDCPEEWIEKDSVVTYHWYEEGGQRLRTNSQKYTAYIPLS